MAAAPTAQEIQRKLSTSRVTKPPLPVAPAFSSGAESDSDSVFSPDASSPSQSAALFGLPAASAQHPLTAIVERRTGSGEESDEDDDEEDGAWRNAHSKLANEVAAQGPQEVKKSGYLSKKGTRRKTWKKRWFVLRGAHLAYYKSSAEYKLLKLLDLTDVHSVTSCSLKHHKFTFGIVSPNKTLYLQAESDADMAAWVHALNDARTALQNLPSIAPAPTKPAGSEAIPIPPTTPRTSQTFVHNSPGRSIGTPSPPGHYIQTHHHHVASSDSEAELSPTAIHSTMQHQQQQALNAKGGAAAGGGADASKTILAGYLMKCSSKRRNWRKRWFTLTAEKLVYTTSHMDARPHRVLPLTQILDALEVDMAFPAGKHPQQHAQSPPGSPPVAGDEEGEAGGAGSNTFKVITPKRTLLLCAPSEEEEIKWLSAIRALIARRSGGTSAVPPQGAGPSAALASAGSTAGAAGAAVPSAASTGPVDASRPSGRRPSIVEGLA